MVLSLQDLPGPATDIVLGNLTQESRSALFATCRAARDLVLHGRSPIRCVARIDESVASRARLMVRAPEQQWQLEVQPPVTDEPLTGLHDSFATLLALPWLPSITVQAAARHCQQHLGAINTLLPRLIVLSSSHLRSLCLDGLLLNGSAALAPLARCEQLTSLTLRSTTLDAAALTTLSTCLPQLRCLHTLSLQHQQHSLDQCLFALAGADAGGGGAVVPHGNENSADDAACLHSKLRSLELLGCAGAKKVEAVLPALAALTHLTRLALSGAGEFTLRTADSDDELCALLASLPALQQLTYDADIGMAGMHALLAATHITSLTVQSIQPDDDMVKALLSSPLPCEQAIMHSTSSLDATGRAGGGDARQLLQTASPGSSACPPGSPYSPGLSLSPMSSSSCSSGSAPGTPSGLPAPSPPALPPQSHARSHRSGAVQGDPGPHTDPGHPSIQCGTQSRCSFTHPDTGSGGNAAAAAGGVAGQPRPSTRHDWTVLGTSAQASPTGGGGSPAQPAAPATCRTAAKLPTLQGTSGGHPTPAALPPPSLHPSSPAILLIPPSNPPQSLIPALAPARPSTPSPHAASPPTCSHPTPPTPSPTPGREIPPCCRLDAPRPPCGWRHLQLRYSGVTQLACLPLHSLTRPFLVPRLTLADLAADDAVAHLRHAVHNLVCHCPVLEVPDAFLDLCVFTHLARETAMAAPLLRCLGPLARHVTHLRLWALTLGQKEVEALGAALGSTLARLDLVHVKVLEGFWPCLLPCLPALRVLEVQHFCSGALAPQHTALLSSQAQAMGRSFQLLHLAWEGGVAGV
ncbi:hypothetical protein QJQ45_018565 [Haematococcus lacustris]|nr:hypothetical protein QJQ45_018565 [Haematococcus lacustris]